MSETEIEQEIQTKGLNAPRLTPDHIDSVIVGETYHVFPGTTMTVCALTLRNGFIVTGESAAASPENFDAEIGRKIARANARNNIWALEGYLLRERLSGVSMERLVERFLTWRLPNDVAADVCATEAHKHAHRSGTCLLTAAQAEQMLRHVLAA